MTTLVLPGTLVVKRRRDTAATPAGVSGGGLSERIEWVVSHGRELGQDNWNMSQWALRAGLQRTHVRTILERLEENPDAGIEHRTLQKLADAAGVSVCWLAFGSGAPLTAKEESAQRALAATRAMGEAMGFAKAFLAEWAPPVAHLDADSLWTMMKADYVRWQAGRPS